MSFSKQEQESHFRWYIWLLFLFIPLGILVLYILREIEKRQQTQVETYDEKIKLESLDEEKVVVQAKKTATVSEKPGKTIPAAAKQTKADDLKKIEGIGPKISQVLTSAGVDTFNKLAGLKPDAIKNILEDNGVRLGFPETWPEQARLAADNDWDALKKLQESLKGGRKQ